MIWQTAQANHFPSKDVECCAKEGKPVVVVGSPDDIQVLFPVYQLSLADCGFSEGDDYPSKILRYSWMEIKFAPQLILVYCNDIFVPDLFTLQEAIALVNLCVGADDASKLLFHLQEVLFVLYGALIFLILLLLRHFLVKDAWGEVLGVEDADLLLVDQHKQQAFVQEEALVDREPVANVEAVEFYLGRRADVVFVCPYCQLNHFPPSYRQYRVSSISKCWRQAFSPVEVWDGLRLNVVRSFN